MTLLVTGVLVLAAVEVLHLLLTFGLIARLRLIQEQGIAKPVVDPEAPQPGLVIDDFRATDLEGNPVSRKDLVGPVLTAFFTSGCPQCSRLAGDLVASPPREHLISFVEGDLSMEGTRRLVDLLSPLGRVCLIEVDDPIVLSFALSAFPTVLRTHSGVVVESGSRMAHLTEDPALVGLPT
jgi:hypothetical protein